jgi:isoquinoline 1-oxidoreductase beta subunit
VAQVGQVEAAKDGNESVRRAVCAVDYGTVVNPDTVRAQVLSVTAALHGAVPRNIDRRS